MAWGAKQRSIFEVVSNDDLLWAKESRRTWRNQKVNSNFSGARLFALLYALKKQ